MWKSLMLSGVPFWSYIWGKETKRLATCNRPQHERLAKVETKGSSYDYFSWLSDVAPCYPIHGDDVLVLTEPKQFYEILKSKARKAKKRVTLASLYLGTETLEAELVDSVQEACSRAVKEGNKEFKVNVLLDYTRGSRGQTISSRTMLQPLLKHPDNNVKIALYHTPDLRGLYKLLIPDRFNETIGLTHVKAYIFDDSVIISGANLSDNYFTNRQDRYVLFNNCPDLADFFDNLVQTISKFSFQLQSDNTVTLHPQWKLHPYKGWKLTAFTTAARTEILNFIESVKSNKERLRQFEASTSNLAWTKHSEISSRNKQCDTWVYPLIQMKPFEIIFDEIATLSLFNEAAAKDEILLASGYFNLTDNYLETILKDSQAKFSILMAAPEVNGFYGAKGVAGLIPLAYIHIARVFYQSVCYFNQDKRIKMYEYTRPEWTFHVKGLWYYLPNDILPALTLIGSPNFGYRSVYRDLECQTAIVTDNDNLRKQLREEHVRLYQSSNPVNEAYLQRPDRQVSVWAKVLTSLIKSFF
ncbi:hypothetical protein LOTGIDRAFT_185397 [Lottia gigantea]|uniref:CDP-diacylglycerol--glycerol-3-phosphate 3-phosphatidyltransferase n=1 Tax=Lottia gigantea TaxID=225164 RepID=V4AIR8_LOTGI|nr:hypothetical protein LOTGIDRAFT_185397 [Lottia gigantea]ESP04009.1 hypothetical protein LOTGIDRAFT_185397 [Lottia gigantea]